MLLSKQERLILFNQYEILKNINPDNEKEYKNYQEILSSGYTENYCNFTAIINEPTPKEVQKFVYKVLDMFRGLNDSYIQLSDADKSQIKFEDIIYQGFDGNEEGEYYMYANFLLESLGLYAESYTNSKHQLNSHCNKVSTYSKMIKLWDTIADKFSMDLENIKNLIAIN